jgi:hypothetical protein
VRRFLVKLRAPGNVALRGSSRGKWFLRPRDPLFVFFKNRAELKFGVPSLPSPAISSYKTVSPRRRRSCRRRSDYAAMPPTQERLGTPTFKLAYFWKHRNLLRQVFEDITRVHTEGTENTEKIRGFPSES